jgi:Fe-S-cluster-containing dehydrogenase component
VTWIDADRCLPYFVRNNGCSICIKVCPFHERDYAWLKERWERHGARTAELQANPPPNFPEHLRQTRVS